MSATVYWTPKSGTILQGGSGLVEQLQRAFHALPLELSRDDLPVLRGMAAMWTGNGENPFDQLANAIVEHGLIEVDASY